MRYLIQGLRKSGKEINNNHEDYKLAKFDFECLSNVSKWATLYQIDNHNRMKRLKLHIG